jgi:hypothetical protein
MWHILVKIHHSSISCTDISKSRSKLSIRDSKASLVLFRCSCSLLIEYKHLLHCAIPCSTVLLCSSSSSFCLCIQVRSLSAISAFCRDISTQYMYIHNLYLCLYTDMPSLKFTHCVYCSIIYYIPSLMYIVESLVSPSPTSLQGWLLCVYQINTKSFSLLYWSYHWRTPIS